MVRSLAQIEEWEWREFCQVARLNAPWRDVADHLLSVEKLPSAARQAWMAEQIAEIELVGSAFSLDDRARRKAERTLKRAASTAVGTILNQHEAKHSAQLMWWASRVYEAIELD